MSADNQNTGNRRLFFLPVSDINQTISPHPQSCGSHNFVGQEQQRISYTKLMGNHSNGSWCSRLSSERKSVNTFRSEPDQTDWSGASTERLHSEYSQELNKNRKILEHVGGGVGGNQR